MLGWAIHRRPEAPGHGRTTPRPLHSSIKSAKRGVLAVKYCAPESNTAASIRFVASRPPKPRLFSKTTTSRPRARSSRASIKPAIPAPTTANRSCIRLSLPGLRFAQRCSQNFRRGEGTTLGRSALKATTGPRAVFHLRPNAVPFFPPSEFAAAVGADLGRQIGFAAHFRHRENGYGGEAKTKRHPSQKSIYSTCHNDTLRILIEQSQFG